MAGETLVRQELVYCLDEWSLTSGGHRQHILNEGIAQFGNKNDSATFQHLRNDIFPQEYAEAIRFFFRQVLRQGSTKNRVNYRIIDKLEDIDEYMNRPYCRKHDKKDKSKVFAYRLRENFGKVAKGALNPKERFNFLFEEGRSESERIFEEWFLCSVDSFDGMVFEAVLACHAIYKEACFYCKSRNSLRWNGGADTSWMDLVCVVCNSTYEVKTKASMEKCESEFERNKLRGGSYDNYWRHRNAIRDKNQKMFCVILPRQWTMNRSGKLIRPVSCYEIDYVLPDVQASCFRPIKPPPGLAREQIERYRVLPLKSVIKLKKTTVDKAHWFSLQKWETPIDCWKITEEEFIQYFSKEEFTRLESKHFIDSSSSGDSDNEDQQQQHAAGSESGLSQQDVPSLAVNPPTGTAAADNTVERLKAEIETFTHELGHLWGCRHEYDPDSDFARGFVVFQQYSTIMATRGGCQCPGNRLPVFSDADKLFNGLDIGNANFDCVRRLETSRVDIAKFRDSATCDPTATPSSGPTIGPSMSQLPTLMPSPKKGKSTCGIFHNLLGLY